MQVVCGVGEYQARIPPHPLSKRSGLMQSLHFKKPDKEE